MNLWDRIRLFIDRAEQSAQQLEFAQRVQTVSQVAIVLLLIAILILLVAKN